MTHKICVDCMAGKQHQQRFQKTILHRVSQVLELIHIDLVGPFKAAFLRGSRYFIEFTDDYSRKSWEYFMKQKGKSFQKFREFKARVGKETWQFIITLGSDHGGEYMSHEFHDYCKTTGILQEFTMPCTPQQNGVAECCNCTIIECARSWRPLVNALHFYRRNSSILPTTLST
jgi:transposase InsO family protein